MRYWPILLLGLLQLPTPAQGGAWLREKGTGFTSTTVNVTRSYDIKNAFYSVSRPALSRTIDRQVAEDDRPFLQARHARAYK